MPDNTRRQMAEAVWKARGGGCPLSEASRHEQDLCYKLVCAVLDSMAASLTRVEIIGEGENDRYHRWADTWVYSFQDDCRTLKLFPRGSGEEARIRHKQELAVEVAHAREAVQAAVRGDDEFHLPPTVTGSLGTVITLEGTHMQGRKPRRTRTRLSVAEADGTRWVSTLTKSLYWFQDGTWRQSMNVYYGKDLGWRDSTIEPQAMPGFTFIEFFDDDNHKDPKVIEEITLLAEKAAGIARLDSNG